MQENPWVTKMKTHCESYIRKADGLAKEADDFAQFHTMRAREAEGK